MTGHVTTAGTNRFVEYTHAVEYSDGELATDALTDLDAVALPVRDAMKPPVLDADADGDRVGDGVGDTITHCT